VIAPLTRVVDAWLRRDITVRASVIHERLVAEHGFTGSYQRVKIYVGDRPAADRRLDRLLHHCDVNPDSYRRRSGQRCRSYMVDDGRQVLLAGAGTTGPGPARRRAARCATMSARFLMSTARPGLQHTCMAVESFRSVDSAVIAPVAGYAVGAIHFSLAAVGGCRCSTTRTVSSLDCRERLLQRFGQVARQVSSAARTAR